MIQHRLRLAAALISVCALPSLPGAQAEPEPPLLRVVASASLGETEVLHAVAAHSGRVVAVGDAGLVLESKDGGKHWERHELAGAPPLIDVCACGNGRFFFLDFRGGLWRAREVEGGEGPVGAGRWERHTIGETRSLALTCDPAGRLWAVGEQSAVMRSNDQGLTWTSVMPGAVDRLLTDIVFLDRERGRIVGEFGTYLLSDDGGGEWREGPAIPGELYPHAVAGSSNGDLVVVGNGGGVFRSNAETWSADRAGVDNALYGVVAVGASWVAIGERGVALHGSHDGSGDVVWHPVQLLRAGATPSRYLRGLDTLEDGALIAVGAQALLRVEIADAALR